VARVYSCNARGIRLQRSPELLLRRCVLKKAVTAAALILSICFADITRADIVINAIESGGNVIFSYSGEIDTDALGTPTFTTVPPFPVPSALNVVPVAGEGEGG